MTEAHPSRLETLLQQALPEPRLIKSGGESAIVALALHCLMVDAGFRSLPAPDAEPQPEGDCRLPAGWNSRFKDVWAFEYRRDGCENAFLLHVSLHPVSRKMLIQLMEGNSQGNVRSLGLLPGNYVTDDPEALRRRSWAGVLKEEERLADLFTEHVTGPATEAAEPARSSYGSQKQRGGNGGTPKKASASGLDTQPAAPDGSTEGALQRLLAAVRRTIGISDDAREPRWDYAALGLGAAAVIVLAFMLRRRRRQR